MEAYNYVLPTPSDIKAARAYLDWSQEELAKRVGMSTKGLINIEKRASNPSQAVLNKIMLAFLDEGISFASTGGFLANQSLFRVLEGEDGFREFFDELIAVAQTEEGKEFLGGGVNEEDFINRLTEFDILDKYEKGLGEAEDFTFKIMTSKKFVKGPFDAKYIQAKALPDDMFVSFPVYIYGNKVALLLLHATKVFIISDKQLTDSYREQFNELWNSPYAEDL
ncbi:MAG: helix-turn-helix transcriptional regulator [Alphaproteobacteria bacterium]|nr:helix-turn-helix transcriptional regulator [Alphaproteobacteria bacterium]